MRRLGIVEFLTLDGVMQGFGGPEEDREGDFEHGGWGAPYATEEIGQRAGEGMGATTAYLFGRKTYEHMAAHWPNEPDENPIARHLNATPKYVVTRTLTSLDWGGSQILDGDVVESVSDLKTQGDGFITVLGSGELVQTLIEHRLIDDYIRASECRSASRWTHWSEPAVESPKVSPRRTSTLEAVTVGACSRPSMRAMSPKQWLSRGSRRDEAMARLPRSACY